MNHKLMISGLITALTFSIVSPATLTLAATTPPPTSTAVPRSKWISQPIKFGTLETYTHDPAWFEIDVPTNWTVDDTSKDDEAIVTFTDPTKNGAVFTDVFANSEEMSKTEMADKLTAFTKASFGTLTKFTATAAAEMQNLNGASQFFRYSAKLSNGKSLNMYGDAFYEQYDNTLVSIIVLLLPEEQYITVKKQAYSIVDSFKAMPENYVDVTATPTEEPTPEATGDFTVGDLTDFTQETGVYTLRVPEAWTEKDNSSGDFVQTIWQDSTGTGLLIASAAAATKTYKTAEMQTEAVNYIKSFTKNTKSFTNVKIGTKSTDNGAAFVAFSYTYILNGDEVPIVGVVAVKQTKKTVGFLQLAVPAANANDLDAVSQEIFDSFTIDGDVSF